MDVTSALWRASIPGFKWDSTMVEAQHFLVSDCKDASRVMQTPLLGHLTRTAWADGAIPPIERALDRYTARFREEQTLLFQSAITNAPKRGPSRKDGSLRASATYRGSVSTFRQPAPLIAGREILKLAFLFLLAISLPRCFAA